MRIKRDPQPLEKAEEKWGDLDGDGERGEDPRHQQKVRKAEKNMAKKALPPAFLQNAKGAKGKGPTQLGGEIPSGGLKPGKKKAKAPMCPDCMKSGAKSCNH